MTIYVRFSALLIIILFLSTCTFPSEEELANTRNNLANVEDALMKCRLLVLQKDFEKKQTKCADFLKKDVECSFFSESKEGCIQFINSPDYNLQKMECQEFTRQVVHCEKQVEIEISSWFFDIIKQVGLNPQKNWVQRLRTFNPEIHFGVIWSGYDRHLNFIKGIQLAVEEINMQGGILSRTLKLHIEADDRDLDKSRKIAKNMSYNKNIRAIIGMQPSLSTIPSTSIYEESNIVYLTVSATNNKVIRYGMRFIFRQIPNNDDFARALISFCTKNNYRNIVLLYSRDIYSEELSYALRDYIIKNDLKIIFEKSFFDRKENFLDIATEIKELKLDAILLVTPSIPTAKQVVYDLRNMEITTPLIGVEALDSNDFATAVGIQGNGFVVPTIYNPFSKHPENTLFVKAYKDHFGLNPDTWAAQGYDAIKLLTYIMNKTHSTVPVNVATGLRYMQPQIGATGKYAYEISGELTEKQIYFKELQHEEFILFKDSKGEEVQQKVKIVDDRVILRPEKPSESSKAMSSF